MKQNKGLVALLIVGILAIVIVIAFAVGQPRSTVSNLPKNEPMADETDEALLDADDLSTKIISPGDSTFEIEFEDTHAVANGSTVTIPIDIKNAAGGVGNGITGYHITLNKVPAVVTKATLQIDKDFWPVNASELADGKIMFFGEDASNVVKEKKSDFFILKLEVGKIAARTPFFIDVVLADNAVPSKSHRMKAAFALGSRIFLTPKACVKEGGSIPVVPDAPGCCEGLTKILPIDPTLTGSAGICTAKCGNGVCDAATESNYNCPKDCPCVGEGGSIPVVPSPPLCCKGLSQIPPKAPDIEGSAGICTAKCGNGVCDSESETEYNCRVDCLDRRDDCAKRGKDIAKPTDTFDISDITELGRRLLNKSDGEKRDTNRDKKFDISDVVALDQCYLCKWDWRECGRSK